MGWPDGALRILHAEGRVVADGAGRPVRMMGIGHDVTEQKLADEAREQARASLSKFAARARDLGVVKGDEPFLRLFNQGQILGPDGQPACTQAARLRHPALSHRAVPSGAARGGPSC